MTFSGHAAISIFTLALWRDPAVLIPVNIAAHLLTDAIPHAEFFFLTSLPAQAVAITIDTAVVLALGYAAVTGMGLSLALVASTFLAGFLLDLTDWPARRLARPLRKLHLYAHTWPLPPHPPIAWDKTVTGRVSRPVKLCIQIILVLSAFWVALV